MGVSTLWEFFFFFLAGVSMGLWDCSCIPFLWLILDMHCKTL